MANGTDINSVIEKVTDELLKKYEVKYREAGKAAMREIRESIVKEWFGEYSFHSMNGATQYKSHLIKSNGSVTIEIESYIDVDVYDPKPEAERWVKKYGGMMLSKDYVLGLQLDEGIIGLPEKSYKYPEHNWTNPNFIKREPLWDILINDNRWNDFESYFWKYAK